MKTAERISYIREVSDGLDNYDWPDLDLILREFGLPTSDSWGSSKKAYVIHHLNEVKDSVLQELRAYVVGSGSSVDTQDLEIITQSDKNVWKANRFRLFISHLTANKLLVSEIKERLSAYGVDCFVAHEDIDPTLEWQDVIETALQSCDALAAFLTKDFHASNWTDQEIGFCVARRILIIPIKIDINPYGFIGKYQAKNCSKYSSTQIAEEIFSILLGNSLTSAKINEAIVSQFIESRTWESARARSLLLSKIKTWTPELLRSIEGSIESNEKIGTAFDVPERIRRILTEHSQ